MPVQLMLTGGGTCLLGYTLNSITWTRTKWSRNTHWMARWRTRGMAPHSARFQCILH